jgi:hypothetical protein
VASKLKITYLKGSLLDVRVLHCSEHPSSDNERYAQVKVQYNACSLFKSPYFIFGCMLNLCMIQGTNGQIASALKGLPYHQHLSSVSPP